MKYIVMGRTGCGKTTFVQELEKHGMRSYKTYTTRPPRNKWDNGYHFVKCLPNDAVLKATVNGFDYAASAHEMSGADWDVIILEPNGFFELAELMTIPFCLIYIESSKEARRERSVRRGSKSASDIFDKRDAAEDALFTKFEHTDVDEMQMRWPKLVDAVRLENSCGIECLIKSADKLMANDPRYELTDEDIRGMLPELDCGPLSNEKLQTYYDKIIDKAVYADFDDWIADMLRCGFFKVL